MTRYKIYRDGNPSCYGDFGDKQVAQSQAEKFNTPDLLANSSGHGPFRVVEVRQGRRCWSSYPVLVDSNAEHRITQREG